MKILFLDIDGVCNSATYAHQLGAGGMLGIDPVPAALVRDIIAQTGCSVVLSSTWRLSKRGQDEVRSQVCEFVGTTPSSADGVRGGEVRDWLLSNIAPGAGLTYAILDDDTDFSPNQPLFNTTWEKGLTPEIAAAVIAHLNK
jgi:hypothetical protein